MEQSQRFQSYAILEVGINTTKTVKKKNFQYVPEILSEVVTITEGKFFGADFE